jgi:hypothetical protein
MVPEENTYFLQWPPIPWTSVSCPTGTSGLKHLEGEVFIHVEGTNDSVPIPETEAQKVVNVGTVAGLGRLGKSKVIFLKETLS